MLLHVMKSVEEACLLALELEPSFRAPLDRRLTSIARKRFSRCHHAYQCLIKCPECDGIGHYDFQWPTKSLHTEIVHINDIDHSRINEMSSFLTRVLMISISYWSLLRPQLMRSRLLRMVLVILSMHQQSLAYLQNVKVFPPLGYRAMD